MRQIHKVKKQDFRGKRMSEKEIELVRVFADPDKERDQKILEEVAIFFANKIKEMHNQ
jgi:hypothetical protein